MNRLVLHLEADSLEELRAHAYRVLGLDMPGTMPPEREQMPDSVKDMANEREAFNPPINRDVGPVVTGAVPKPRRAHRATKPVPAPVQEEPEEETYAVEMPEKDKDGIDEGELGSDGKGTGNGASGLKEMLANEALKKETIAQLGALFAAGKVKVVRNALDKYGKGAKSFPEIDASQFPAIAAALARGDIA